MTAHRIPNNYYAPDEFSYGNNTKRVIPRNNHNTGIITSRTKSGSYNIVEKDFGDHKVIYHIPVEYGDDYDISQLEETPTIEDRQQHQQGYSSPRLVRRRIYQEYDNVDYDDEYEYVEEIPISSPRRRVYVSPRRQTRDVQVIRRIYEPQPVVQPVVETVEYIYEDEYPDVYNNIREKEEEVEYVVRERVPKQTVRLNRYAQLCQISITNKYILYYFYFYFSIWKNPDLLVALSMSKNLLYLYIHHDLNRLLLLIHPVVLPTIPLFLINHLHVHLSLKEHPHQLLSDRIVVMNYLHH
jgi:hypothetical protein